MTSQFIQLQWNLRLLLQVFIYGGVGPLPSDVTVAGVAKAFGVRMVHLDHSPELLTSVTLTYKTFDSSNTYEIYFIY